MGMVLLLLTLIVKAVVFPATWKTYLSSAKMRVLKPKIDVINQKYPKQEDAMKKQQEIMTLYSQYGVSPMGGCLPMLIQMPVLIALFMFIPSAIELRQQGFLWADDLSTYDAFVTFPFRIPFLGDHLSLFCVLMTVTNILNTKYMMQQQDTGANPQMAAMKWMSYLMPVMFLFILNDYPSGLNYYYFLSTLISVATTLVLRKTTNEAKLLAQLEANKKDPKKMKTSGFAARLEAMQKQQEELMKLQEQGYKPTAGCMPMLVNFLVMFGVIEVVYRPLQRIFHIGADALTAAGEALTTLGISFTTVTRDTNIIAQVIAGESTVTSCFTPDQVSTITEFGQHMDFFGIDLTRVPQYSLAAENLPLLILPVLAIVTMFLSTHISMKASGQQMQGSMKLTMYMMPLMYLFFCFTYPLAFSLYYVISNIVMTVQTQVMRKVYDPEKMRKEVEAQIEEKKKQQKRGVKSTTVKVTDPKTGKSGHSHSNVSHPGHRSIERRAKEVRTRESIGHWEIDSVIGKASGQSESLLVISERKTRAEIILKAESKTSAETVRQLRRLRRYFGSDWKLIFHTLTSDNGSEFADQATIDGLGVTMFYCHPQSPHERGTNEVNNKLIRRKFPKGQSLSRVTQTQATQVQHWVNNYSRPMFGGSSAADMLKAEFEKLPLNDRAKVYRFFGLT